MKKCENHCPRGYNPNHNRTLTMPDHALTLSLASGYKTNFQLLRKLYKTVTFLMFCI